MWVLEYLKEKKFFIFKLLKVIQGPTLVKGVE